jgi:hypothetical protein
VAAVVGLGGFVVSNPVVATNSDSRLELFVIESDHPLYHNFQLSAVSSGTLDQFGITELYPSKASAEHYNMNMQSEGNDPQFDPRVQRDEVRYGLNRVVRPPLGLDFLRFRWVHLHR